MIIDALFLNRHAILAATSPMHSVTAVINLATLHKTSPIRFIPQEHHVTWTDLIPGDDTPTSKDIYHNLPTMDTDMGGISTDHNCIPNSTVSRAAAAVATEGIHCAPIQTPQQLVVPFG